MEIIFKNVGADLLEKKLNQHLHGTPASDAVWTLGMLSKCLTSSFVFDESETIIDYKNELDEDRTTIHE